MKMCVEGIKGYIVRGEVWEVQKANPMELYLLSQLMDLAQPMNDIICRAS